MAGRSPLQRIRNAYRQSPTLLLLSWFSLLIAAGTLLLALPFSHRPGRETAPLTALFTATSAACVTGLSLVDVAETYSFFGQAVLLFLIELGGIGVMAFANLSFGLLRRRMSLSEQAALTDSLFQSDAAGEFRKMFGRIMRTVALVQALGFAGLLAYDFATREARADPWFSLWSAAFHSVSAFCNAGFSVYHANLESMRGKTGYLAIVMALIILGGLGFQLLAELGGLFRAAGKRARPLSLNSRVALTVTGVLLVAGAVCMRLAGDGMGDTWTGAAFHAVSARTAGFNILPLDRLPLASCLILCFLMFVGGSPGSCAGGVKTTSVVVWLAHIRASLHNDANVNMFGYTIAPDLVSRTRILMALSVLWNAAGVMFLSVVQPGADLAKILFEQISAFATVGLTLGLTPGLAEVSQLWIIATMFIGRLGPLTLILWTVPRAKVNVGRPIGRIMVG